MRTVMDQRDDYDIPIMDAGAVRALHARFVASNDIVEPNLTRNVTVLSYNKIGC